MKIRYRGFTAMLAILVCALFVPNAWGGSKQRHRWEGVAIGIGATIVGSALINHYGAYGPAPVQVIHYSGRHRGYHYRPRAHHPNHWKSKYRHPPYWNFHQHRYWKPRSRSNQHYWKPYRWTDHRRGHHHPGKHNFGHGKQHTRDDDHRRDSHRGPRHDDSHRWH